MRIALTVARASLIPDSPIAGSLAETLRSQQEIEQSVEDHLRSEIPGMPPRPMALVLTKAGVEALEARLK